MTNLKWLGVAAVAGTAFVGGWLAGAAIDEDGPPSKLSGSTSPTSASSIPATPSLSADGMWMQIGGIALEADDERVTIDPVYTQGDDPVAINQVFWGYQEAQGPAPSIPPREGTEVCATVWATPEGVRVRTFEFGKVFLGECDIEN